MLSEALFRIQNARSSSLSAEAEEDDVHRWCIDLGGFDPATGLGRDLAAVRGRWGYDTVAPPAPTPQAATAQLGLNLGGPAAGL